MKLVNNKINNLKNIILNKNYLIFYWWLYFILILANIFSIKISFYTTWLLFPGLLVLFLTIIIYIKYSWNELPIKINNLIFLLRKLKQKKYFFERLFFGNIFLIIVLKILNIFNYFYFPVITSVIGIITIVNAIIIFSFYLNNEEKNCISDKKIAPELNKNPNTTLKSYLKRHYNAVTSRSGLTILFTIAITLLFIAASYGTFLTTDEPRWINSGNTPKIPTTYNEAMETSFNNSSYSRSEGYWDAYLSGNFKATFNNANPSATLHFLHFPAFVLRDYVNFSTYLSIARFTIIIHNIFLLLIIYFIAKKLIGNRQALLLFIFLTLSPLTIGMSQIINHDSVQGIYIISFILSLWSALKFSDRKYYCLSGLFFGLALITDFKSAFLPPLLFFSPLIYSYIKSDRNIIKKFILGLPWLYFTAILTAIIILPAALFYPHIIINRLFFYQNTPVLLATILSFVLIYIFLKKQEILFMFFKTIKKVEASIVRFFIILIISCITFIVVFKTDYIFGELFDMRLLNSLYQALISSYAIFFFSIPIIIFVASVAWLIFYLYKPKIDFSSFLFFLFFILIFLAIASTYTANNKYGSGYKIISFKYLFVILPIFLVAITSSDIFNKISKRVFNIIIMITIIILFTENYYTKPFFIHYNNFFLPKGYLITQTTWALDTLETSNYIKYNLNNVTIYNSRGQLNYLVPKDINVIPWYEKFWLKRPQYIVIGWEKNHKFTKIFDYYRKNKKPIWHIKKNGVIYTGIYKFDSKLNYNGLL